MNLQRMYKQTVAIHLHRALWGGQYQVEVGPKDTMLENGDSSLLENDICDVSRSYSNDKN